MASDLVKEMLEDLRTPLYQNAIFLIANTALAAAAGFLFWVVVARLYPDPDEVGRALILVGVLTFVSSLANLGFGVGLIRFLPRAGPARQKMVNSCLTVSTLVALVLAGGVLATMDLWFPDGEATFSLALLVPVFLILPALQVQAPLVDNTFVAGRQAGYVLVRSALYQGSRLLFPFLLVGLLGLVGILASLAFAHVLGLSVAFALLLPRLFPGFRPGPAADRTVLNHILHFSLHNHVAEIFHVLPYPVILVMVSRLTGVAGQAAFFGIPWLIASLLFAVPLMASVSLYAEGSHFEESLRRDLKRTLRFILPLLVAGILFLWFLGDWILSLFGPEYAREGLQLLKVLALSGVFVTVNGLFISVARVLKWVKAIVALWAFVALGTIGLAYLLIPTQGVVGAGTAWLMTNAVASVAVVATYLWKRGSVRDLLPWEVDEARG